MAGDKTLNRVLIADDNTFIRFLVKKWLEDETQVIEVAHGKDVVDTYKTHAPNIVFLDIHMPGRSGKDVLKDILALNPAAFVVMLSADSMKENVLFASHNGAKAFITKPFTRETLYRYFTLCPTIVHRGASTAEIQAAQEAAPPDSAQPASS